MSEPTPGPWFAGKTLKHDETGADLVTVGPFAAECHYEDTICEVWGENHPAEANARLIAAAPDLPEALHAIISEFRDGNHTVSRAAQIMADLASAAIAKAEAT